MTKTLRNTTRNTIGNSATALKGNSMLFTNSFVGFPMFFKSIALALAMLVVGIIGGAWGQVNYTMTWASTGLNSWTNSGTFAGSRTTTAICATTASVRSNVFYAGNWDFQ